MPSVIHAQSNSQSKTHAYINIEYNTSKDWNIMYWNSMYCTMHYTSMHDISIFRHSDSDQSARLIFLTCRCGLPFTVCSGDSTHHPSSPSTLRNQEFGFTTGLTPIRPRKEGSWSPTLWFGCIHCGNCQFCSECRLVFQRHLSCYSPLGPQDQTQNLRPSVLKAKSFLVATFSCCPPMQWMCMAYTAKPQHRRTRADEK